MTAIPYSVKTGDVVTISRASCFGVVTVEHKCLGFAFGLRKPTQSLLLVASRSPVVDCKNDSSKMSDDALRDVGCVQHIHIIHGNAFGK